MVAGIGAPAFEPARDSPFGRRRRDGSGCLEHQRVATLSEPDDEDLLPRRRGLQHVREHHERMRGPRLAARPLQVVAHATLGEAELSRHARGGPAHRRREAEVVDRAGIESGCAQRAADRLGNDLHEPLVANPALFPDVVEALVLSPVVVDEIGGAGGVREQLGDAVAFADEQRGGGIAGGELEGTGRPGAALLGTRDEHRPAAAPGDLQRRDQRRRAGALRTRDVQRSHRAREVQRLDHHAGVLAVLERQGGGREEDLRDPVPAALRETVARSLDRHRDRILVPVRDGPLAASERHQRGAEPRVGLGDRPALQAQPGDVAAEGVDAGTHRGAAGLVGVDALPVVSGCGGRVARRGRFVGKAALIPGPS